MSELNSLAAIDENFEPETLADMIQQAVVERATDIHLDTWNDGATLRFRVDGIVHPRGKMSAGHARRLINQVKVAAELPVEATLTPLEGQFRWSSDDDLRDIRATMVPSAPHNDALHLRLLNPMERFRDVEHLGMSPDDLLRVRRVLGKPHGLILVAGTTGSGKTTSLYALTHLEDLRQLVAMSIEDPVEFDLPLVRQVQVDERRGLTMEEGLRVLLRMDPDILMLGEIRDHTSAVTATQAAMAGRLVFTSIHARDGAAAVEAIHYLGVPYFILGGALRLVISQTLVRKICSSCARKRPPTVLERTLFEQFEIPTPEAVPEVVGCDICNNYGYLERVGAFEIAELDGDTQQWLATGPRQNEMRTRFAELGARPFVVDALRKAAAGITSMHEVQRLLGLP